MTIWSFEFNKFDVNEILIKKLDFTGGFACMKMFKTAYKQSYFDVLWKPNTQNFASNSTFFLLLRSWDCFLCGKQYQNKNFLIFILNILGTVKPCVTISKNFLYFQPVLNETYSAQNCLKFHLWVTYIPYFSSSQNKFSTLRIHRYMNGQLRPAKLANNFFNFELSKVPFRIMVLRVLAHISTCIFLL